MKKIKWAAILWALTTSCFLFAADLPGSFGKAQADALLSSDRDERGRALQALRTERESVINELCNRLKEISAKPDRDYAGPLNTLITALGDWRATEAAEPLMTILELQLDPATFPRGSRADPARAFPAAQALGRIGGPVVTNLLMSRIKGEMNDTAMRLSAYVLNECFGRDRRASAALLEATVPQMSTVQERENMTRIIAILRKTELGILP